MPQAIIKKMEDLIFQNLLIFMIIHFMITMIIVNLSPSGPRFEAPPYSMQGMTPSKMAIQQMIRTRHPGNMHQWANTNQPSMQALQLLQKQQSHRMVRQQIRQTFQNHNRGVTPDGSQAMFSGGMHSMNQNQGECVMVSVFLAVIKHFVEVLMFDATSKTESEAC